MPGGVYNPGGNSYGNRYPYQGGSVNGPYPGVFGGHGLLPPDLESKSSLLLPLAGAALLGKFSTFLYIST